MPLILKSNYKAHVTLYDVPYQVYQSMSSQFFMLQCHCFAYKLLLYINVTLISQT